MASTLALKLIECHYPVVVGLHEYLVKMCDTDVELEKPGDTDDYLSLLRESYIAIDEPLDALPEHSFKMGDVMSEIYEIIDRVQTRLFDKAKGRPWNILTLGYRRADHRGEYGRADMTRQGITNYFPNTNITALQSLEWKTLLTRIGEAAFYDLLFNTSIFISLPNDSFCQLTGTPVTDLLPHTPLVSIERQTGIPQASKRKAQDNLVSPKRRKINAPVIEVSRKIESPVKGSIATKRNAADVLFTRYRMLYARPVMTHDSKSGGRRIAVGLPPNHVLNRLAPIKLLINGMVPSRENIAGQDARHVLKYIFPRQFGLRNPFILPTSQSNGKRFEDYMDRDEEIQARGNVKTPPRLKSVVQLIEKLIRKHWACNYRAVRSLTCPSKLKKAMLTQRQPLDSSAILEIMAETAGSHDGIKTQASMRFPTNSNDTLNSNNSSSILKRPAEAKPRFAEFTCSHKAVFAYIRNVTKRVIPQDFWGSHKNFITIMKHVHQFVKGRRWETTSLHTVLQEFSTQDCDWLLPLNHNASYQRPSVTDALKRRELVEDFLHWYFDYFVIPLVRTSFYATDSGAFRQRILYFRLDDWTSLCRPLLENLAEGTFRRLDAKEAKEILSQRKLGFSFIRLLPKETGVRPIVNLRKKSSKRQPDGSPALSINQVLQATFQILSYEKLNQPHLLGASVSGRNEIYAKLKDFKVRVSNPDGSMPKLYFVKVDVKACFDSIAQDKLLEILQTILSEDGYMLHRFARLLPVAGKVQRTFWKRAVPEGEHPHFLTYASKLAGMLRHAVLVDQVVYPYEDRDDILQLLKEHVTENIVKIGSDYYRQMIGIPQGSVLSTILCAFFYGDLERKIFNFTEDVESVICRLVDDYLLITTSESKAKHFLDMMNKGHPEYGCFISPEKTLTNLDWIRHSTNYSSPGQREFPWCGLLIHMQDLSVSADYSRYNGHLRDSITVERGRRSGLIFEQRMSQMARFKSHVIFWDTTLNTTLVVHRNIYHNFLLTAMKMYTYVRSWGVDLRKYHVTRFILGVIHRTIRYTYKTIRSRATGQLASTHAARCMVRELSVVWLGMQAFLTVLAYKGNQAYQPITASLQSDLNQSKFLPVRKKWLKMSKEASSIVYSICF